MNNQDESQPEITHVSAGAAALPPPVPANKSSRNIFLIIGGLIVFLCGCLGISGLCVGISGGTIGALVVKTYTEGPKVESVIDEYMGLMAGKDASQAYSLLSTRAKRNVSLADNEKLLEGNNYTLFEGYRGLTITSFTLNATVDSDPDMPQGQVAEVEGEISYSDGYTGAFTAVLEKDGDEWRLFSINISVPPDKFGP